MKKANHMVLDNHGETIGEMLVSSLIIALAIVMLVTMVNISARLVKKSETNRSDFFTNINASEQAGSSSQGSSKNSSLEIQGGNGITPKTDISLDIDSEAHLLSGSRYSVTYKKASS